MSLTRWISDLKAFIQYGDLPTSFYVKRGMKVGKNFNRQTGTRLDPLNCWLIEIGDDVIMGNKVQLIAHDFSLMHHTGYARFGRIVIGDRVFIGANTTILMNAHIGNDVVIGAGSLVNKDIPDGVVVAGVPAKVICTTEEYIARQEKMIESASNFKKSDTNYGGGMSIDKRKELLEYINESSTGVLYAKFRNFAHIIGSDKIKKVK